MITTRQKEKKLLIGRRYKILPTLELGLAHNRSSFVTDPEDDNALLSVYEDKIPQANLVNPRKVTDTNYNLVKGKSKPLTPRPRPSMKIVSANFTCHSMIRHAILKLIGLIKRNILIGFLAHTESARPATLEHYTASDQAHEIILNITLNRSEKEYIPSHSHINSHGLWQRLREQLKKRPDYYLSENKSALHYPRTSPRTHLDSHKEHLEHCRSKDARKSTQLFRAVWVDLLKEGTSRDSWPLNISVELENNVTQSARYHEHAYRADHLNIA